MPGSISDVKSQDLAYVHATMSGGSSIIGMDINPDLSLPLDSIYLDEKIGEYYTPATSLYQQELYLTANNSVMDMGIAITTNTAQLLTPFSSPTSPAYYCPFPLPSRSTSLRATSSIMMTNPPPVPPKDIKNPSIYPFPSIASDKNPSPQQTPIPEERSKKSVFKKTKRFRKRLKGVFSGRIRRDFHSRKSTVMKLKEGICTVM